MKPVVVAILLVPHAAAAHIILPGTQPLEGGAAFTPSSNCAPCHGDFDDAGDYEAQGGFDGSAMAHAAKDPVFLAALISTEADSPGLGDHCLRCHAPSAWLEGRAVVPDGSALFPTDRGVECSFCHRLVDGDPFGPYVGNGMFFVDEEPTYGGPFDDALDVGHPVEARPYLSSEKLCGLCHEQSSVLHGMRDPEGDVIYPEFPLDRTWSEWEASAFAAEGTTCQGCHMPETPGRACSDAAAPERTVHRHEWNASDTLLADLLPAFEPDLDPLVAEALADGQTRARSFLQSAATLELLTTEVQAGEEEARVVVRVTNLAGHKLPTGFPNGRRVWLEVSITDAAGTELERSGHYDEAADEIELAFDGRADPDIRIYQARHGVAGFGPSYRGGLNDMVLEDSRIPPRGFAPEEGRIDLFPIGRTFGTGEAAIHQDDAAYDFDLPCDVAGPLHVRVRLLYQRVTADFVEHLRATAGDVGSALHDAWDATGRGAPEEMVTIEGDLEVLACPPDDGGAGDDGDGEWDGIAPAVRRDGGPPPPTGRVPDPIRQPSGAPGTAGCGCRAAGTARLAGIALFGLALLLGRRHGRGRGREETDDEA